MNMDDSELIRQFDSCQKSSVKGDTEALLDLGRYYCLGTVIDDPKAAFECFSKAAEAGNPEAVFELGMCYFLGIGTERDRAKGYNLILSSSENGNHDATSFLGSAYINGDGVKQNLEKGVELLTRASEMGNVFAMEELGFLYGTGKGVQQDEDMCEALIDSAISLDGTLAKFYRARHLLESEESTEEDKARGRELLISASDDEYPLATLYYMMLCSQQDDVDEITERGRKILKQSDDGNCLLEAGQLMLLTMGTNGATEDVIRILEKAAESGANEAFMALGDIYADRNSEFFDRSRSFACYMKAAENGVVGGTSATTFSPNRICTRAQTVTFLWAAAGRPTPEEGGTDFRDVSANAYYRDAVLWASQNAITSGVSNNQFNPDGECSRCQVVTFLYRLMKLGE